MARTLAAEGTLLGQAQSGGLETGKFLWQQYPLSNRYLLAAPPANPVIDKGMKPVERECSAMIAIRRKNGGLYSPGRVKHSPSSFPTQAAEQRNSRRSKTLIGRMPAPRKTFSLCSYRSAKLMSNATQEFSRVNGFADEDPAQVGLS